MVNANNEGKIDMEIGDKVRSSSSLWSNEIGTISGIIKIEDDKDNNLVHVIFPETDNHSAYQQSFHSNNLIIVNEQAKKQNENQ